jgi:hypothetical protein
MYFYTFSKNINLSLTMSQKMTALHFEYKLVQKVRVQSYSLL